MRRIFSWAMGTSRLLRRIAHPGKFMVFPRGTSLANRDDVPNRPNQHAPTSEEAVLSGFIERCIGAWPAADVDRDQFVRWLRTELPSIGVNTLDSPHATALWLVFGCMNGDANALRAFDSTILSQVDRYVATVDNAPWFADEVRQELRERLLLRRPDGPPRIGAYRGRGPLEAWVRAIAIRMALTLRERRNTETESAKSERAPGDPEIDYARAVDTKVLKRALDTVMRGRSSDDREMLRLHYIEGQNIEQVGAKMGVHRATVARRLLRVRAEIVAETRVLLRETIGLGDDDIAGLIAIVQEDADISFGRILAAKPKG